jgi:prepilin-type processing-associated H-X9-DG protein
MQMTIMPLIDCDAEPPAATGSNTSAMSPFPMVDAIYPEYLTDPALLVCPSNANIRVDDLKNPRSGQWEINQMCADLAAGPSASTDKRGLNLANDCYFYMGWLFDRVDATGPVGAANDYVPRSHGSQEFAEGPAAAQIGEVFGHAVIDLFSGNLEAANADIVFNPADFPEPLGNAGTDIVYRLREGIERFLITDINNPAASARAQSDIFVMCDRLSSQVAGYAHIPGGANVLYMDGHVRFMPYAPEGPGPANQYVANVLGAFDLARPPVSGS